MNDNLPSYSTVKRSFGKRMCLTVGELPSSFLESMTYYEALAYLVNYINTEIIPVIGSYEELQQAINDLQNQINSNDIYLKNALTLLENNVRYLIIEGDQRTLNSAANYTLQLTDNLQKQINAIVQTTNPVYDPTTGRILPVQVAIMNVYESGRYDALTASEYDNLEMTAEAYDEAELTAKQYDQHGKSLLI